MSNAADPKPPETVSVERAAALAGEGAVLVDVRTQEEWSEGHLKGAKHVPLATLADNAEGSLKDKNAPILLYCRSGGRATVAAETLEKLGYTNLSILRPGGFEDLKAAGLPTEN